MSNLACIPNPPTDPPADGLATVAGTTVPKAAAEVAHGISELRALPEVAQKVRDIAADPQGTVGDLAEVITSDPALASKLLKLANSAFYGLPSQVGSIHRAIVVLGFKTVQNLALAGALCSIFRGAKISDSFTGHDLWKHCLAVAVAARNLAKRAGACNPEEAFLAGITHDVGVLAAREAWPQKLAEAIISAQGGASFLTAERDRFGTDHTEVGLALTSVWRFPDYLRIVCRFHHAPALASGQFPTHIRAVHLADWLCTRKRIGFYLTVPKGPACQDSLEALGLTKADLAEVRNSLADDIREAERIFA